MSNDWPPRCAWVDTTLNGKPARAFVPHCAGGATLGPESCDCADLDLRTPHAVSALREENARLREQLTVAREAAQVAAVEVRRLRRQLRERSGGDLPTPPPYRWSSTT